MRQLTKMDVNLEWMLPTEVQYQRVEADGECYSIIRTAPAPFGCVRVIRSWSGIAANDIRRAA